MFLWNPTAALKTFSSSLIFSSLNLLCLGLNFISICLLCVSFFLFFFVCSLYFKYLSLIIYYKDNDHQFRILGAVCWTLQKGGSVELTQLLTREWSWDGRGRCVSCSAPGSGSHISCHWGISCGGQIAALFLEVWVQHRNPICLLGYIPG